MSEDLRSQKGADCAVGDITGKSCTPCEGIGRALERGEINQLRSQVSAHWEVIEDHHLQTFDLAGLVAFTNIALVSSFENVGCLKKQ